MTTAFLPGGRGTARLAAPALAGISRATLLDAPPAGGMHRVSGGLRTWPRLMRNACARMQISPYKTASETWITQHPHGAATRKSLDLTFVRLFNAQTSLHHVRRLRWTSKKT
ncbi:MAG: hypothetical protein ACJARE_002469 [Paracoccaceae bacterium]|jgi:hypothetical protein